MDERFEDQRTDMSLEKEEERSAEPERDTGNLADRFQQVLQEMKEGRTPEPDKEIEKDRRIEPEKTEELAKVLYQRTGSIYLPDEKFETSDRTVLSAAVALREETGGQLIMGREALEAAKHTSPETLKESLQTVIRTWNEERGNQYDMNGSVMFKNFPESAFRMSDEERYTAQITGYIADLLDNITDDKYGIRDSIKFDGEKMERPELTTQIKTEELRAGSDDKYNDLVKNLIGGRATLSDAEREIVSNAYKYQDPKAITPDKIPQKDNLAYVARIGIERNIPMSRLGLNNANDALRLAREMNTLDRKEPTPDYSTRTLWGRRPIAREPEKNTDSGHYKLSNGAKRAVYEILEGDRNLSANMKGKEPEFKALARGLHGFRNAEQRFPRASEMLGKVSRNETLPMTKDGRYDQLRRDGEILKAADMRKEFPGKFTKELDSLLTQSMTRDTAVGVVDRYGEVVDRVPVRSLFIAKNHFENREEGKQLKVSMPKDNPRNAHPYIKEVAPIDKEAKDRLISTLDRGIQSQLREREPMGKVYVDERYKGIPIPKDTRTETSGARPISKGTHIPIDKDANCVRAFIHWKGEDLDLSAAFLREDLSFDRAVAYYDQRYGDMAVHSGDITWAPEGASEYIDLRLDRLEEFARENDLRYVSFQVNVFSGPSFKNTEECMFGVMTREDLNSGEIYDPRTVDTAFDLKSDAMCSTTILYDITNREMIWTDMDVRMDSSRGIGNIDRYEQAGNVDRTINNTTAAVYSILHAETPSMYDVLTANAEARGELVSDPREADIVFGMDRMSDDVRAEYGLDREIEVPREDGTVEIQTTTAEYHDMFDRAEWVSKYM